MDIHVLKNGIAMPKNGQGFTKQKESITISTCIKMLAKSYNNLVQI